MSRSSLKLLQRSSSVKIQMKNFFNLSTISIQKILSEIVIIFTISTFSFSVNLIAKNLILRSRRIFLKEILFSCKNSCFFSSVIKELFFKTLRIIFCVMVLISKKNYYSLILKTFRMSFRAKNLFFLSLKLKISF